MKIELVRLNEMTKDHHIYTEESFKDEIAKKKEYFVEMGESGHFTEVDMSRVSHVVTDLRIEDGVVYATAKALDTPMGKLYEQMKDHCEFSPSGFGYLNDKGEVEGYQMSYVSIVSKYD